MNRDTLYATSWKSRFCQGGRIIMERPGLTRGGIPISPALYTAQSTNQMFPRSPQPAHLPLVYTDPEVNEMKNTLNLRFPNMNESASKEKHKSRHNPYRTFYKVDEPKKLRHEVFSTLPILTIFFSI